MSISSCPRCTQQVTLPVGVSASAIVRCPLCRAEYTLADALVNMPPLLEVLDELTGEPSASWCDMSAEQRAGEPRTSALDVSQEAANELSMGDEAGAPAKLDDDIGASEELPFEAVEFDDDVAIEQQDTEIEELSFEASEAEDDGTFAEIEPIAVAAPDDEDVLSFDERAEAADALAVETPRQDFAEENDLGIDFGEALPAEALSGETELEINASPAAAEAPDEFAIDFGEPQEAPSAAGEETMEFNEHLDPRAGEEVTFEFNRPFDASSAEEEIGLDFGDPVAHVEPAVENKPVDETADGKQDKKKKKKEKKPRAAAGGEPRKRSWVGMLTNVVLPSILAVPLALYGVLWISPDYDFFAIGPKLPSWMAPAKFSKRGNVIAQAPPTLPPGLPQPQSVPPQSAAAPADAASDPPNPQAAEAPVAPPVESPEAPAEPPAQEKPAPAPADKPAEAAPSKESPANEPALTPVAPPTEASPVKPTADAPSREPKDDSLDSLLKDDTDADQTAKQEKMPAAQPAVEELPEPGLAKDAKPSPDAAAEPDPFGKPNQEAPQVEKSAAPAEAMGLRNPRPVTPGELTTALQDFSEVARKMTAAETTGDKMDLKKLRASYYLSLYRLADTLTLAKSEPLGGEFDASRQGARDRALELAADPTRLKELKSYGGKWLAFTKRTTDGVALAGTVQSTEQAGKLYEVKLALAPDAPSVMIVSSVDPGLASGDEMVALGTIVDRPQEQLAGYEGSEAAVVWSGLAFKVPPAEK